MTNTYIIDAYNVIHASEDLRRQVRSGAMEQARIEFMNGVAAFVQRRSSHAVVVFDGVVPAGLGRNRVQVISSRTRSADDIIREEARRHGRTLIVVTSDAEIVATARDCAATVVSAQDFAADVFPQGPSASSRRRPPNDGSARPNRIEELREESEKPSAPDDDELEEFRKLFE